MAEPVVCDAIVCPDVICCTASHEADSYDLAEFCSGCCFASAQSAACSLPSSSLYCDLPGCTSAVAANSPACYPVVDCVDCFGSITPECTESCIVASTDSCSLCEEEAEAAPAKSQRDADWDHTLMTMVCPSRCIIDTVLMKPPVGGLRCQSTSRNFDPSSSAC